MSSPDKNKDEDNAILQDVLSFIEKSKELEKKVETIIEQTKSETKSTAINQK